MNAKTPKKGQQRSRGRRPGPKRPYSTIDLKATDLTPEEQASAALQDAEKAAAKPAADSAFAAPDKAKAAKAAKAASGLGSVPAMSGPDKGGHQGNAKGGTGKSAATGTPGQGLAGSRAPTGGSGSASAGKPPPPPPPPSAKAGGGGIARFFTHLAAGIIGGLLALLGANYAGSQLGLSGLSQSSTTSGGAASVALSNRISGLEKQLAARPSSAGSGPGPQVAALEKRIAGLEALGGRLDSLATAQGELRRVTADLGKKLGTGVSTELAGRLGRLEQTLASLGAAARVDPKNAGRIPQLAAISGRVNDLETSLSTRISELRRDIVQEIDSRVAATSEASEAARSGAQRLGRDMAVMRTGNAKIDQRLIELKASTGRMGDTLRIVQEETGALKAGLDGVRAEFTQNFKTLASSNDVSAAIAPVTSRIGALEQNLLGVVKSEQDRKATAHRIVLALELGKLKRAMDRGQDFSAELSEVRRAAGASIDLSALEAHQNSGVPTLGALQKDFRPLAYRMIDSDVVKQGASVIDRLLHGARSMVRIRKVNHDAGDSSTAAIVGRMEEALKDGRLSDLLATAAKLPEKARLPAKDWLAKVRARELVDSALAGIEDKLKASLSGPSLSGPPLSGSSGGGRG